MTLLEFGLINPYCITANKEWRWYQKLVLKEELVILCHFVKPSDSLGEKKKRKTASRVSVFLYNTNLDYPSPDFLCFGMPFCFHLIWLSHSLD